MCHNKPKIQTNNQQTDSPKLNSVNFWTQEIEGKSTQNALNSIVKITQTATQRSTNILIRLANIGRNMSQVYTYQNIYTTY